VKKGKPLKKQNKLKTKIRLANAKRKKDKSFWGARGFFQKSLTGVRWAVPSVGCGRRQQKPCQRKPHQ